MGGKRKQGTLRTRENSSGPLLGLGIVLVSMTRVEKLIYRTLDRAPKEALPASVEN